MAFRVLCILVMAFSTYSWAVYLHCDDKNKEGVPDEQVKAGWALWQQKNCQSCHQLYGLGGYMGPDLTNVCSDPGKGAPYMRAFMKHGTAKMPDFNLSDTECNRIISFLSWVDKSGTARVPESAVHWTGTYNVQDNIAK